MRKPLWLILWTAGILFPVAWLGRFSQGFRQAFDSLFGPLWMHILTHAGLFAVLAILLTFQLPKLKPVVRKKNFMLILSAVLLIGLLQEGLQSLSAGRFLPGAALFDLGIDLAGGLVGAAIMGCWQGNPGRIAHPDS